VQAAEIRFLFAYDRWATKQVLTVLDGLDSPVWSRPNDVGERGLPALAHRTRNSNRCRPSTSCEGRSPGELDLINYAEERAAGGNTEG
jgi:hypothetical protein